MPISRIMLEVVPESGTKCEASAASPVAEPTADSASSTGTPAATIAPNATSRMSRVTGRLKSAAAPRSWPTWSLTALFSDAPPTCSTRSAGKSFWTVAVALSRAPTRSEAVSGSPLIVTSTISALPFLASTGASTWRPPAASRIRAVTAAAAGRAAAGSSCPARAVIRTSSVAGSDRWASCGHVCGPAGLAGGAVEIGHRLQAGGLADRDAAERRIPATGRSRATGGWRSSGRPGR